MKRMEVCQPPPPPTRGARLGLLLHDVYLRPFPPGGF